MKRILSFIIPLIMMGCVQSYEDVSTISTSEEFYATIEGSNADTRTYVDENITTRWHADDRLTIFKKETYNREYKFKGKTGENSGGFTQVSVDDDFYSSETLDKNYAVYPHSNDNRFIKQTESFEITMPAEQTYAENTFGRGANTMVAVSETGQLLFKNVGSYLRVRLWGEDTAVSSVTITSNGDEVIAGEATVKPTLGGDPTCVMIGSTKSITLNCPTPVTISESESTPTDFWIVLPPVTFEDGFSVTIKDSNDNEQTYNVDKSFTFARNTYYNLKREVTLNETASSTEVPSNQIWYTSTDGQIVTPYKTDVFGANIVSNVYENGKGVITFDGDVTKIGEKSFRDKTPLKSIQIPNTVRSIDKMSFLNCSNLMEINIPERVVSIGDYAFNRCSSLNNINLPNGLLEIGTKDGLTFDQCLSLTSIVIPNSVTTIGGHTTFAQCHNLSTVTLGTGLKELPNSMFLQCSNLLSITIPENVDKIGTNVFVGCENLSTFYGKFASSDNKCLIVNGELVAFAPKDVLEYTIPSETTSIAEGAFCMCNKLREINIPESIMSIGPYTFYMDESLETVKIPANITILDESTFQGCKSLNSIVLPSCLEAIESSAFEGCSGLETVKIYDRVCRIESRAFYKCEKLVSVFCDPLSPPSLGLGAFNSNASDRKIYVPSDAYDAYIESWSAYASDIEKYNFE